MGVGRREGTVGFLTSLVALYASLHAYYHFDKKYTESKIWERLAFFLVSTSVWVKGIQERP